MAQIKIVLVGTDPLNRNNLLYEAQLTFQPIDQYLDARLKEIKIRNLPDAKYVDCILLGHALLAAATMIPLVMPAQQKGNRQAKEVNKLNPGGIDLNAANLNLHIRRDGNGVPLPVSQQDLENIHLDGLVPVIP